MTVLVLIETVLLAILAVLVAGLLRAYATVLQRLHKLDGGGSGASDGARTFDLLPTVTTRPAEPAASSVEFGAAYDITGESLSGELVSARVVDVEHDTLLLFLSSGCASCEVFWNDLAGPIQLPARTRLLVVPQSAQDESRDALGAMAPVGVDVVMSSEAWTDYGVPGSPHVVFVDGATGRVRGEGTGQSLGQITQLLARSSGHSGLVPDASSTRLDKSDRDAEQEAKVDRELLAAGIRPGDPSLYGQ